jgi:hypothetical protein
VHFASHGMARAARRAIGPDTLHIFHRSNA